MHNVFCVGSRHPLVLGDFDHHLVAPCTGKSGHGCGSDKLSQAVSVQWGLSGRGACHGPHAGAWLHEGRERLPAVGAGRLDLTGLVHNDEVKPTLGQCVCDHLHAVEVDDDEIRAAVDDSLTLLAISGGDTHCAMHDGAKQVGPPRCIHDGHWAHHQHAFDLTVSHQVVSSPRRGGGLAGSLLVKAKAAGVGSKERSGGALVIKRGVHPGPLVPAKDGVRWVFDADVVQHLPLVKAPVDHDLGLVVAGGQNLTFGDERGDLVGFSGHKDQGFVVKNLHGIYGIEMKKSRVAELPGAN